MNNSRKKKELEIYAEFCEKSLESDCYSVHKDKGSGFMAHNL